MIRTGLFGVGPRRAMVLLLLCATTLLVDAGRSYGQAPKAASGDPKRAEPSTPGSLRQFDAALKELTTKVSPAVVQIIATGYGLGRDSGVRPRSSPGSSPLAPA